MEYDEFIKYCEKGRCLRRTIVNEKTCARDGKRQRCYKKFSRISEKSSFKTDPQWEEVRKEVRHRDMEECRLWNILTPEEKKITGFSESFIYAQPKDPAHVIRRSQSRNLYYELKNIYSLSRVFHSRLDGYLDPLTGKAIRRAVAEGWWIRIIGEETWSWLNENK